MSINPKLMTLISLLSDGHYYSGEQLGEAVDVSRAAVWKYLQQLDGLGLNVLSRKGLGYCLDAPLELLDRKRIESALDNFVIGELSDLSLVSSIDSTNQYLMDLSAKGESISRLVVSAEKQSQGRGRRGRSWYSPFAKNLYLSIGWRFHNGINAIEGLSLAVGVAICRALATVGMESAELKWPNDVLVGGRKLGGVLIELAGDMSGDCDVIVGVGLNVHMKEGRDSISEDSIGQPWTSVVSTHFSLGSDIVGEASPEKAICPEVCVSRNHLLAELINELFGVLVNYESDQFSAYKLAFQNLHAFQGQLVSLVSGGNITAGVVEGVSDRGGLLLNVGDNRIEEFHGGEVSLRLVR